MLPFPLLRVGAWSMRFLLILAGLTAFVLSAGCGGGDGLPAPAPMDGLVTVVPREQPGFAPPPTATSWPTFTPAPTEAPATPPPSRSIPGTPTPETRYPGGPLLLGTPEAAVVAPAATVALEASATAVAPVPAPSPAPVPIEAVPSATPEPSPTPYGRIPDGESGEARFVEQSLFPLMLAEVATSLLDDFPPPTRFISRDVRFVVWAVRYDMTYVAEDFSLDGFVQWWDMGPPEENPPFVMLEEEVSITKSAFQFHHGLGRQTPGFWQPGPYRVAFLDADHKEVVSWDFEVR